MAKEIAKYMFAKTFVEWLHETGEEKLLDRLLELRSTWKGQQKFAHMEADELRELLANVSRELERRKLRAAS